MSGFIRIAGVALGGSPTVFIVMGISVLVIGGCIVFAVISKKNKRK